ncbi:hypothetical protein B1H41_03980 [Xanthomonas vasicola pv. vasculorum]|nr:hypothetical protein B1H41_03980 [Xanthomonas vasicola pv. vasculorum]OWF63871.1 hypothetical protein B1H32_02400 [Xanthomonas vasicola pv. vasculorum]
MLRAGRAVPHAPRLSAAWNDCCRPSQRRQPPAHRLRLSQCCRCRRRNRISAGRRSRAAAPGALVCFDNLHADGRPNADSLHAGLPVTAGSKWLGTLWFRQQRYRDW